MLAIAAIAIISQSSFTMANTKTETQPYRVVKSEKEFEIRFYPAATLATVTSSAKSYRELASPGFRRLASYIFGGNETNKSIAMTSPVHMDINDSLSSMSFVMPSEFSLATLPKPNDATVTLQTSQPEYVAAIRFGGYASEIDIKKYSAKLATALKEHNIQFHDNFRFLGYNAPFDVFNRRNEVIVKVDWKE
jgi:hypothetical protein